MTGKLLPRILLWMLCLTLAGCGSAPPRDRSTLDRINAELRQAVDDNSKPQQQVPESVNNALLPPLKIAIPKASAKQLEQRFDLVINDAPANQVFMGIVSGTRYSMLVHPEVKGNISVNLKDVTVFEALDAIRDMYGYEYRVEGSRIFVESVALQTRVFQVNYINSQRTGASDTQVISNSANTSNTNNPNRAAGTGTATSSTGTSTSRGSISSSVRTQSSSDFWPELSTALNSIIGDANGRKVIVNPQASIVLVRAMPAEIRSVEKYLRLMQVNIERQVILEAKIIEVELNDQSQAGVNWAVFGNRGNSRVTIGNVNPDTFLGKGGGRVSSGSLSSTGSALASAAVGGVAGSLFAIAVQAANFSSLISFLESQGDVHVLSSPRIATINNQKAVLKVGTDEFFVTGVSTSTIASTGATTTVPEVTLNPFFSGIALDVTPQIDENSNITLHIHPSVSDVSTVTKLINIGTGQTISLPLASSKVSETDSIVRAKDGQVIAIGGLMKQSTTSDRSKVPGLGDTKGVGAAFRQHAQTTTKSELVILLKPTVVMNENSWSEDILSTHDRIGNFDRSSGAAQ
ncbi:MAG TPA: pilus (MSHA type) biogenesis protein MshL [Novimethylophilus sp.]|jgi:MSHA biogenesis protein MshL|uniref:pilus (MSHA type) biogenesis protein MshL n=1 Tax=Novimethylophilus sp. TaxID=2137426 RepID=UPI002F41F818